MSDVVRFDSSIYADAGSAPVPGANVEQDGSHDVTSSECDRGSSHSSHCRTLQQQMEDAILASLSSHTLKRNTVGDRDADSNGLEKPQMAPVRSEIDIFQSSGVRGRGLQLVYNYLMSIPPASVEAEFFSSS